MNESPERICAGYASQGSAIEDLPEQLLFPLLKNSVKNKHQLLVYCFPVQTNNFENCKDRVTVWGNLLFVVKLS